jgi:hypothetical protein
MATPAILAICILLAGWSTVVSAEKYENITIAVPARTFSQNNHTYCVPSKWSDVAAFFLANYVTHAATVKSLPGEPTVSSLVIIFFTLLFPASGVMRALSAISQSAVFYSDPLTAATRAGALCMVIRTKTWKPQDGETVQGLKMIMGKKTSSKQLTSNANIETNNAEDLERGLEHELESIVRSQRNKALLSIDSTEHSHGDVNVWNGPNDQPLTVEVKEPRKEGFNIFHPSIGTFSSSGRRVHGTCCLPEGYGLMIVPPNARVLGLDSKHSEPKTTAGHTNRSYNQLSTSYSLSKPLIAILQVLYASFTLYRTQGDQLDKYGYAAFGLTVASYLVMSLLNLVSSMLTPDFASVFLVQSDIMKEASNREGAKFEGMVGILQVKEGGYGADTFEARFHIGAEGRRTISRICRTDREGSPEPGVIIDPVHSFIDDGDRGLVLANPAPRSSSQLPKPSKIRVSAFPPVGILSSSIDQPIIYGSFRASIFLSILILGEASLGIVGGISRFHRGDSTLAQRVWTMFWLVWGFYMGPNIYFILEGILKLDFGTTPGSTWIYLAVYLVYCVRAIGGFVVVGQMLKEYGTCYITY